MACVPAGESKPIAELSGLASAALVEIDAAEGLHVTPLELEGGRLPRALRHSAAAGRQRSIVTLDETTLRSLNHRIDRARTARARISLNERAMCGDEGEILDGQLSLGLVGRARVFDEAETTFTEHPMDEPAPGWLASLQVETPALPVVDCMDELSLELVRVFSEESVLPRDARVAGELRVGGFEDPVDLIVLADGRIAVLTSFYLLLRTPGDVYVDDPRFVRKIYAANTDGVARRGAMFLASEDESGEGELWYVSRDGLGAVHLEAVHFDREGLKESRVLSRIPVEDDAPDYHRKDVARLLRLEDGSFVGLSGTGLGLLAPGPQGPWQTPRVHARATRTLTPVLGRSDAYLFSDLADLYLWRPFASVNQVEAFGEFPLREITGIALREVDGELEITVTGSRGLLATKRGLLSGTPWQRPALELPHEPDRPRRCVGGPVCERNLASAQIWEVQPALWGGEEWLMFSVDGCPEALFSRVRDGCPRFVELDSPLDPGIEDANSRRIVERRGRWFRLGSRGDVRELVSR